MGDEFIDISTDSEFFGLTTFANLPYVNCFSPDETDAAKYDIAILGAPFDTSVTGRPGARFGPAGIRRGSQRIAPGDAWNIYTGENTFMSWAKIVDCGDVRMTFLDNRIALKQLEKAHQIISGQPSSTPSKGHIPRIVVLGGDHTTTLAALRSTYDRFGAVSVIHFDSHLDTWDPNVLGGELSTYAGVNHGTFLHIAHEEGLILNSSIHAAVRAPVMREKDDLSNDHRCGFSIITARDIDLIGAQGVIDALKKRVRNNKVYISLDIDSLDPAFAPATGTSEPGGWSTREMLTIIDGLKGLQVVGADVVEVAPIYDNPGETTVLAAAEIVQSLLTLMVQQPIDS
ncbi:arginase [Stipitochalara longipes BDJ]|nr:arginase [Stipitochalara longipes BDJ]